METNICNWNPSIICPFELTSEPENVFIIGSNADDRRDFIDKIINTVEICGLTPRFAADLNENNGYDAFCQNICKEIRICRFVIVDLSGSKLYRRADGR